MLKTRVHKKFQCVLGEKESVKIHYATGQQILYKGDCSPAYHHCSELLFSPPFTSNVLNLQTIHHVTF